MVAVAAKKSQSVRKVDSIDIPKEDLRWCSVSLLEVFEKGKRLDASVFDIDGKHAQEVLEQCKWDKSHITGDDNSLADAYYPPRFKRIFVEKSKFPLYLPSQIQDLRPKPKGFMSYLCNTDLTYLVVKKGQILITRSGTIGNCSLVDDRFDRKTISDDIIRINAKKKIDIGFIYAFLRSNIGSILIKTNQYGAVVSHIEPEHLNNIPIPNPPDIIKRQINNLIAKSFELRDESNKLLDKAEKLLYDELDLPPIEQLKPNYFDKSAKVRNYAVKLSSLNNRLDGSYHVPIVDAIIKRLRKTAAEITTVADPRISKDIILPGRFKRVYVEEGQGTVFFGGRQIYELDSSNKKYLSLTHHGARIKKELELEENTLLITCSGTIGKVAFVPEHWQGWTANQHIIRIVPTEKDVAGYLYVFLNTSYGYELIKRFTYGMTVDEIDRNHAAHIQIPLLKNQIIQREINSLALEANKKRTQAYNKEQQAIEKMNEMVIYATK